MRDQSIMQSECNSILSFHIAILLQMKSG